MEYRRRLVGDVECMLGDQRCQRGETRELLLDRPVAGVAMGLGAICTSLAAPYLVPFIV